jgi:ribosomal protein S5
MYRHSRKNEEFNQFFADFKTKNEGKWKSIVNGLDIDEDTFKQETELDKKDEIEMLKEFEKRRKFKTAFEIIKQKEMKENDRNFDEHVDESIRLTEKKKETPKHNNPESLEACLSPNKSVGEMFDPAYFHLIFLDADMVCNMTRLNRVYERRCLLYIGNKDGLISYGIGRGPLYEDAYIDAYKQLKKNMIAIPLDYKLSCPVDLRSRFNDYRLNIRSRFNPSIWGHHIMCLMLRYAGLLHVGFWAKSRKKEPYAMVFAFFKAVTRNKTPLQTSEIESSLEYKQYVGRSRGTESSISWLFNK